jgi:gas vesicle protein
MENEKCCSRVCCVLSFLAGAAVGGGIALLTAPKSGERTRRQLKRMVGDVKGKAEDYYDDMKDRTAEVMEKFQDYYEEAKRTLESTVDAARKTFEKSKE